MLSLTQTAFQLVDQYKNATDMRTIKFLLNQHLSALCDNRPNLTLVATENEIPNITSDKYLNTRVPKNSSMVKTIAALLTEIHFVMNTLPEGTRFIYFENWQRVDMGTDDTWYYSGGYSLGRQE